MAFWLFLTLDSTSCLSWPNVTTVCCCSARSSSKSLLKLATSPLNKSKPDESSCFCWSSADELYVVDISASSVLNSLMAVESHCTVKWSFFCSFRVCFGPPRIFSTSRLQNKNKKRKLEKKKKFPSLKIETRFPDFPSLYSTSGSNNSLLSYAIHLPLIHPRNSYHPMYHATSY